MYFVTFLAILLYQLKKIQVEKYVQESLQSHAKVNLFK